MDGKPVLATGVSLGTVTAYGQEHQSVFIHADEFAINPELHLMLPIGGLGIPVTACSLRDDRLLVLPMASDLTSVDDPWNVTFAPGVWEVLSGIASSTGTAKHVFSCRSTEADSKSPLLIELAGFSPTSKGAGLPSEEASLFLVGLWLACTQLGADSGNGFGHTRVAAGLAATSPFAAESLQSAVANALGALTDDGRARFAKVPLPKVVNRDIVNAVASGVPIVDLFEIHGSARTTIGSVWVLALLSRLLVDRGSAYGHSVATLLGDWIGSGNPWWMWRATSIAMSSYEDSIPVSVLESRTGGAAGSMFWWLHELATSLRVAEQSYGRLSVLHGIEKVGTRPSEASLPLMDLYHALLASPRSTGGMVPLCGVSNCEACRVAGVTMRAPWTRSTLARSAVWSLMMLSDLQASWQGAVPGDNEYSSIRTGILTSFTGNVESRVAPIGRGAQ